MALLIEGVNGTFTLGDETFRGPWPAYAVFHVPQAKIVEMESMRPDEPLRWQGEWCCWLLRPYRCERTVQGHHVHECLHFHGQPRVGTSQKRFQIATVVIGTFC